MFEKEAEEFLDDYLCCNLIEDCKSGVRCRCSMYENNLKMLVLFANEVTKELEERELELKKQLKLNIQQDKEVWVGVVAKADKFLHRDNGVQ